jgi:hypothetical protein
MSEFGNFGIPVTTIEDSRHRTEKQVVITPLLISKRGGPQSYMKSLYRAVLSQEQGATS